MSYGVTVPGRRRVRLREAPAAAEAAAGTLVEGSAVPAEKMVELFWRAVTRDPAVQRRVVELLEECWREGRAAGSERA